MNFRYQHTFQVRDGQVQRPQPKPGSDIETIRSNEQASLMFDRFQEFNQEVSDIVSSSAGFDQLKETRPEPASATPPASEVTQEPGGNWFSRLFGTKEPAKPAEPKPEPPAKPATWGIDHAPLSGEVDLRGDNHLQLKGKAKFDPSNLVADGGNRLLTGVESASLSTPKKGSFRTVSIDHGSQRNGIWGQNETTEITVGKFTPGTPPRTMASSMMCMTLPPIPATESTEAKMVHNPANKTLTLFSNRLD